MKTRADAAGLAAFVAASPSPFHAVETAAALLRRAGFEELDEAAPPRPLLPGRGYFLRRGGALAALRAGSAAPAEAGFRILGAHTDSPGLRVKPRPDAGAEGYRQLAVEPYGGLILATWADRDLGLSGAVALRGEDGDPVLRTWRHDEPVARVPTVAIHLDRKVNEQGLKLDRQRNLPPILGLGDWDGFSAWLAGELGVEADDVLGWELGLHDLAPPAVGGLDGEFLFAPRLDNLASCYAAVVALVEAAPAAATQVVVLFDHEEVGSRSRRGAAGPVLRQVLARAVRDHALDAPGGLDRAAARSWLVSADMVHAVHPNYADLHEPGHKPVLGGGPVVKTHAELRYATDAEGAAFFRLACAEEGVPCQDYAHRSDLPCGSTIGPIASAELGIRTVDVGAPMLSMHSVRELAGTADVPLYARALRRCLER